MVKLIIAGSRAFQNYIWFEVCINNPVFTSVVSEVTEVISGVCPTGVDFSGEIWAHSKEIPVIPFPAMWSEHGPKACPLRNKTMARAGDALLLIWDGKSRGSASMKREMQKLNKPVYEVIIG